MKINSPIKLFNDCVLLFTIILITLIVIIISFLLLTDWKEIIFDGFINTLWIFYKFISSLRLLGLTNEMINCAIISARECISIHSRSKIKTLFFYSLMIVLGINWFNRYKTC